MKRVIYFLLAVFLSIIPLHSGRTDANGGHYDRSTGEYHYHHGYPAHQHENGICPYDFNDQTRSSSASVSRSSQQTAEKPKRTFWEIAEDVFLIFVAVYSVYKIVWLFFIEPRIREKQYLYSRLAACRVCGKRIRMSFKVCPLCGAKKPFSRN